MRQLLLEVATSSNNGPPEISKGPFPHLFYMPPPECFYDENIECLLFDAGWGDYGGPNISFSYQLLSGKGYVN